MQPTSTTPVLVLGGGLGLTMLGVIRTLGRARIPAYVAGGLPGLARRSRWYRPAPATAGQAVEDDLSGYLRRLPFERAVLMPCSDAWSLSVARRDPGLWDRFPASQPTAEVLETFLDKGRFAAVLDATGVPHPRTQALAGVASLAAIPGGTFSGSFLKPCDSQRFFQRFEVKAFRVATREEAAERLRVIEGAGLAAIFQEYIPGPARHHVFVDGFLDRAGRLRGLLARRRLRMFPLDFGNSSCMVSVPADEVAPAVASVERLLAHVGYRGIFSAEFKYDERDGLFKILEVNARPWWYVEFTARCGVDVCTQAYRDALGEAVEPAMTYEFGRTSVYPYYDFGACRELRRRGELSGWAWARSWLTAEQSVFRWSDPLPWTLETARGVRRRLRRMLSPATGAARPPVA